MKTDIVFDITGGAVGTTLVLVIYNLYMKYQADKKNDREHEKIIDMINREVEDRQKADQALSDSLNSIKLDISGRFDQMHQDMATIKSDLGWLVKMMDDENERAKSKNGGDKSDRSRPPCFRF